MTSPLQYGVWLLQWLQWVTEMWWQSHPSEESSQLSMPCGELSLFLFWWAQYQEFWLWVMPRKRQSVRSQVPNRQLLLSLTPYSISMQRTITKGIEISLKKTELTMSPPSLNLKTLSTRWLNKSICSEKKESKMKISSQASTRLKRMLNVSNNKS